MGLLKEFKEFAMKGNVIDMAVGIVIGVAFGKIVSSLVADVITPGLGVVIGGVNFTDLAWTLKEAVPAAEGQEEVKAVVMSYGKFLQAVFDFLIVAAAIFAVIKLMNEAKRRLEKQEEAKEEAPAEEKIPADIQLLTEIRDELRGRAAGGGT